MKKLFPVIAFLLITIYSEAQNTPSGSVMTSQHINLLDVKGLPIRNVAVPGVEGTPYLVEDWSKGTVKFANGVVTKDVPLRLDLMNNKVYFKKDEAELEFVQPVWEFTLNYPKGDSAKFRSGYPAIDRNNNETWYEVLADGKLQLLKYRVKTIQSKQGYGDAERKSYYDKDQLYAMLPDGKMISVKKDKDDLMKAIPSAAEAIKKIVEEKKLKLRNEEQLRQLFVALNQPS